MSGGGRSLQKRHPIFLIYLQYLLASFSAMATACSRSVTLLEDEPECSVPRLYSSITYLTLSLRHVVFFGTDVFRGAAAGFFFFCRGIFLNITQFLWKGQEPRRLHCAGDALCSGIF